MISHITPDMETNGGGRFLCAVGGCVGLQTTVDALFGFHNVNQTAGCQTILVNRYLSK